MPALRLAQFAFLLALSAVGTRAADSAAGNDFFENKIRPLLIEHCLKCHDGAATDKPKGGLALDTRAGWEKGGEHGPAIVPGQPDKSLFIRSIRYTDKELQMPPKGKQLTPSQIALFEEWVRMGAPDPRTGKRWLLHCLGRLTEWFRRKETAALLASSDVMTRVEVC